MSFSVQHGGECLMAVIDLSLRVWYVYFRDGVLGCQRRAVSALSLTSRFSHKTSSCKALMDLTAWGIKAVLL